MRTCSLSIAFCSMILLSWFQVIPTFAWEGYFGENPGFNFYTMIDEGTEKMTEGIENKMLQERRTYGWLMRSNPCRNNTPWILWLPIDRKLLEETTNGLYSRLIMLARSRNVNLDTNSAVKLAECISTSYQDLKELAANNQENLERVGSIGLYTDGETGNSDYDIINDISKINKIIFIEEEKYTGTKNIARISLARYLAGNPVSSMFGSKQESTNNTSSVVPRTALWNQETAPKTTSPEKVTWVTFWDQCWAWSNSVPATSVENLMNENFISELNDTLATGNYASSNLWYNYATNSSASSGKSGNQWANSSSDFFHKIPCSSILCIKVRMVSWSQNLLGGGQNKSIEGILDRHIKIMSLISEGNLAGQKMTHNMYELNWSSLKFSNIIPKPLIYVAYKPQNLRHDKELETSEKKDAKLQKAFQCASYSANLPSDPNMANMITWWSYNLSNISTYSNVTNPQKEIAPKEPEQRTLDSCLDVAFSEGRKSYYQSFSTDITEIAAFTAWMIEEINQILEAGKRIDKLRVD